MTSTSSAPDGAPSGTPTAMDRSRIDLPASAWKRAAVTLGRATFRRCPYCGGGHVFKNMTTLKDRCPTCGVLYAYEDGYFLGSYVINLVSTELLTVLIVVWMIAATDMSVLEMQIAAVVLAVGMPLAFYSWSLLYWVVLDILVHPPRDFSERPRI